MELIDIREIEKLNADKGGYWFSPSTLRFFRSRYSQTATKVGNKAYFVSSEQFTDGERKDPRRYTVRVCDLSTGDIETVGRFQQYRTQAEANRAIKKIGGVQ